MEYQHHIDEEEPLYWGYASQPETVSEIFTFQLLPWADPQHRTMECLQGPCRVDCRLQHCKVSLGCPPVAADQGSRHTETNWVQLQVSQSLPAVSSCLSVQLAPRSTPALCLYNCPQFYTSAICNLNQLATLG